MSIGRIVRVGGLVAFLAACGAGGGLEGRYYNSVTGEFALELKGGKVVEMQGAGGEQLTYEVRGDTVFIRESGGQGIVDGMYFLRQANGDLSLEPLGTLTKNRPD